MAYTLSEPKTASIHILKNPNKSYTGKSEGEGKGKRGKEGRERKGKQGRQTARGGGGYWSGVWVEITVKETTARLTTDFSIESMES